MSNTKLILTTILAISIASAHAQIFKKDTLNVNFDGLYIQTGAGNHWGIFGKSLWELDMYNEDPQPNADTIVSLGSGQGYELAIGKSYGLLGWELGVSYLNGEETFERYSWKVSNFYSRSGTLYTDYELNYSYKGYALAITPLLTFNRSVNNINFKASLGLSIVQNKLIHTLRNTKENVEDEWIRDLVIKEELTGGISYNPNLNLNLGYKFYKSWFAYIECKASYLNYRPQEGKITEAKEEYFEFARAYRTDKIFVENPDGLEFNGDEPTPVKIKEYPFSYFAVYIGIRYYFPKKGVQLIGTEQ